MISQKRRDFVEGAVQYLKMGGWEVYNQVKLQTALDTFFQVASAEEFDLKAKEEKDKLAS